MCIMICRKQETWFFILKYLDILKYRLFPEIIYLKVLNRIQKLSKNLNFPVISTIKYKILYKSLFTHIHDVSMHYVLNSVNINNDKIILLFLNGHSNPAQFKLSVYYPNFAFITNDIFVRCVITSVPSEKKTFLQSSFFYNTFSILL